jgi:predicted GNAT family acetyltransferase
MKERRVLAGCETYRKKALVAARGEVKEVVAHAVGSVFCPEQFRGRGYGARMMQEVGKVLESWQAEHCLFSVLFSDIGKVRRSDFVI